MACEGVGRTERDAEARLVAVVVERDRLRDGGREADAVALEIAVVDPDRIEPLVAGLARPRPTTSSTSPRAASPRPMGRASVRMARPMLARQRRKRSTAGATAPRISTTA